MASQMYPLYEPRAINLLVKEERNFVRNALDFADANYPMDWASQKIDRGYWYDCKAWQLYTPKLFHLFDSHYYEVAEDNSIALNDFMDKPLYPPTNVNVKMYFPRQNTKFMIKSDPQFALDPNENWVGCYVAAMCGNKRGGKEYLRAIVVKQFKDENGSTWVSVYKLDFGDHTDLKLRKCRRIPKQFMKCAAVAIQCSMHFEGEYDYMNAPGWTWTSGEVAIWRELMGDCNYRVQFVKTEIHEELPIPDKIVWKVRLHLRLLPQEIVEKPEGKKRSKKEGFKDEKKPEVKPGQVVKDGRDEDYGDNAGLENEKPELVVDKQLFSVKLMKELEKQHRRRWGKQKFDKETAGLPKSNSFWGSVVTETGGGIARLCDADPNWVINLDINNRVLFN